MMKESRDWRMKQAALAAWKGENINNKNGINLMASASWRWKWKMKNEKWQTLQHIFALAQLATAQQHPSSYLLFQSQ